MINRGLGDASQNANLLETGLQELGLIAGQRGVVTRSKRAIAGFKLREKTPVGVSVTLRGDRMYSFLDRLINLALTQRPLVAAGGGERLERASERWLVVWILSLSSGCFLCLSLSLFCFLMPAP